jgi:putative glycosyltransferase (TIGR04348 family)
MHVFMACPAPPRSLKGNRVTAARWANLLKELGHRVTIAVNYDDRPCDLLIALHARKSYSAVAAYRRTFPHGPLIVALTGTDLYRDIRWSQRAQRSLELADRLVLLQPRGIDELAAYLHKKARVIYQSAEPLNWVPGTSRRLRVIIMGHLRPEKDPFRTVLALRRLRRLSGREPGIDVTHLGEALSQPMAERARHFMQREPHYHWLGELSRTKARRQLARSDLMVLSSRMEGGANVLSEAIAAGVPVLASDIPGNIGILGRRYQGYFPVGDTAALARRLWWVQEDRDALARLQQWCVRLQPLVTPEREREAWGQLIDDLTGKT